MLDESAFAFRRKKAPSFSLIKKPPPEGFPVPPYGRIRGRRVVRQGRSRSAFSETIREKPTLSVARYPHPGILEKMTTPPGSGTVRTAEPFRTAQEANGQLGSSGAVGKSGR
jgi:hypothetical protein